jgi:subtilase family serine protease
MLTFLASLKLPVNTNLSGRSHPESPKYGQYWTQDEIHDLFAPAEETIQAVREWLQMFGIDDSRIVHSDNKGWLAFDATVEEAEKLLLTEYYEHEHRHSSNVRVGCDAYGVHIFVFDLLLIPLQVPRSRAYSATR